MLKKRMVALALAAALAVAGWIPAGAEEGFDQPYLVQIAEDDPSVAYVLVQLAASAGLLPLPLEGEYTKTIRQELPDGSKIELPEPEPIHTYNGWKELGYQVKKGEHAKAQFPIWKYKGQKNEETGEEEGGKCYQRKAFWFTFDQVEKAVSA